MTKWLSVADIEELLGTEAVKRLIEGISTKKRSKTYEVDVISHRLLRVKVEGRSEKDARIVAENLVIEAGFGAKAQPETPEAAIASSDWVKSRIVKVPKPKPAPVVAATTTMEHVLSQTRRKKK